MCVCVFLSFSLSLSLSLSLSFSLSLSLFLTFVHDFPCRDRLPQLKILQFGVVTQSLSSLSLRVESSRQPTQALSDDISSSITSWHIAISC